MAETRTFRLGTGAGFSADRLDPAVDLVERGNLDAIVFECLGERTPTFAYRDRAADPSLYLAPLRHHFGWCADDWQALGAGTVIGHLMECAGQITGGYFADPGCKNVDGLARLGFPIAEVPADGGACITKLDGTGGVVDERAVKEQLLYEVHDPARYLTPDVCADFTGVRIETLAPDRVGISGAGGGAAPDAYKLTVAFDGGYVAEAGISYAGPGAQARAELAGHIVAQRMRAVHASNAPLRVDVIGSASLHATTRRYHDQAMDVRLRCAQRASSRE